MIALAVLVVYEAYKHFTSNTAPSGGTTTGVSAPSGLTTSGLQNSGLWQGLLAGAGLPADFLGIINRESNGLAQATCFAPGSNAAQCTPTPKPGDTQGAFGPFQFLNSTWNGLGCTPAAPSDPLGINYAAYNPVNSVACAQRSYQQSGFSAWGG